MQHFASFLIAVAPVAAACGDGGLTPSSRDDITVLVGQDPGLGPIDRVIPGFGVGV